MRHLSSEFLGFYIKVKQKGHKFVAVTNISPKASLNIVLDVRASIKRLSKHPSSKNVIRFNSIISGKQNYYGKATNCNKVFKTIDYKTYPYNYHKLSNFITTKRVPSKIFKEKYKNARCHFIMDQVLFPLYAVRFEKPLCHSQKSIYTETDDPNINTGVGEYIDNNHYMEMAQHSYF